MGRSYLSVGFALLFLLSEIAQLCFGSKCIGSERQALLKFKSTISDPLNLLSSWNATDNCCQWDGIGCHNVTGHVIKLDLAFIFSEDFPDLEVAGVDPSLMQLEHLSYLDLSGLNFHASPIPFFFASMKRLRYLSLSQANFSGKLPYNLGNLTKLHHLDLSVNDLLINDMNWASELRSLQHLNMAGIQLGEARNLVQVVFVLPSLLILNLHNCGLHNLPTPPHPIHYTNISKVQVLHLSRNALHGPIPDVLRNMISLEELYLYENNLSSVPSWLVELKTLRHLILDSNRLTTMECSLSSILGNMCHLKELDLSKNNLQGEAFGDKELSGCIGYDIEELKLGDNKINGSLPNWLGYLKNLNYLGLGSNLFNGPIPISIGKLSRLTSLDLSNNRLNGSIPDSIEKLFNIKALGLSYNNLDGFLPNNLEQLVNLESLDFSHNPLNGIIPQSLGQLVNLWHLDLSNNSFNGNIPQSLDQLVNLEYLDLSNNNLNGTFPQGLGHLVILSFLNLSRNNLHGNFGISFGQLVNLTFLDLSSNNLEGIISESKQWSSIKHLIIPNNQINGSLPENIADIMPRLEKLTLENNLINGSIPKSFCKIETLQGLDLSKNKLSGEIPNCWKDNLYWQEINLSSNKLSGPFPSSFGNLSALHWLHLNNNSLQGELPLSLKNLKQLVILDLGKNQFSGSIPSWTGNIFPSLKILILRQNMLNGSIPSQLCQLASLHILDLASNNLMGSIPHCIGNLTGMTTYNSSDETKAIWPIWPLYDDGKSYDEWYYEDVKQITKGKEFDYIKILKLVINLDLSKNNLVGSIPEEITQLIGLHGLNLSYNNLKGEIPKTIGDMKSLESFDISHNQLSGTIPKSMPTLTSLSYLNMSYNNLSGPIPRENQFLTLDDPTIYFGNPYLCGIPLPHNCSDDSYRQVPGSKDYEDEKDTPKLWFYVVVAAGFVTGFWVAIWTLVLKKSWRHACFRWVDDVADEIYVAIVIKVARLKRMLRNHVDG